MTGKISVLLVSVSAVALAHAARADVSINNKPTSNMSCDAGVCTATAQKAVLNVTDLANMLASGDVAVKTGSVAKDIDVDQPLTWSNTSRLTLDAQQSVTVKKQVTVAGQGALTVITNDTGQPKSKSKTGEFIIVPEHGSVQFWDLSSSLIVDGNGYTLVGDIKTLASEIATNPSGFYALAKPYDASVDGTYALSPIAGNFGGIVEGLGNEILHFRMEFQIGTAYEFGFFEKVGTSGVVRDLGIVSAEISGGGNPSSVAILAGGNAGLLESCWVTGNLSTVQGAVGGLVSGNDGTILRSFAKVHLHATEFHYIGGLAAGSDGIVAQSYGSGSVRGSQGVQGAGGGLLGVNDQGGQVIDSFSVSKVRDGRQDCCSYGGLIGLNADGTTIINVYAAGKISQSRNHQSILGGVIGDDEARAGSITDAYWDLDKGISDPARGAGNLRNDPGIKGLTTEQLQSKLPKGFNSKIWTQNPDKNEGLPYLRDVTLK